MGKGIDFPAVYSYYVLGNVIAVVDEDGHLVQDTDYYPYGLPFRMPASATLAPAPNRHLFGGKEFLTEDGLDEYCQGARQYVPRIPRFDRIDDLAEKHPDHSPYLPFAANPIAFIDPDGNIFSSTTSEVVNQLLRAANQMIEEERKKQVELKAKEYKDEDAKKRE